MLRRHSHIRAAQLALPLLIAVGLTAGAGTAVAQPPPGVPTSEGPWPPRSVLGADPQQVAAPQITAAGSAAGCPSAPYGVKSAAPGSGKTVALTFDDGPGKTTMALLSILERAGTPATFFNLGVNSTVRPAPVGAEATLALALGNHTWDHPRMPTLSASAQASEMDKANAEQLALVGRPPCLFRPPYGEYNATTLSLAQQRHMTVWNWSVDTEDWKAGTSTSSSWVTRIVSRAEAGVSLQHPVILMHNPPAGIPATVAALPTIIAFYTARGYRFVDLLGSTGHGQPGPSAAATASGLHVFARATSGVLTERTRRSDGSWTGWTAWGGGLVGGPAAIPVTTTKSAVFVTGTDNRTWENTITDAGAASGWAAIGGLATSRPAAAIQAGAVVTVLVRGANAAAWMRQESVGEWGGWQSLGGVFNAAPAVAAASGGALVAVGVGTDNALWANYRTATWAGWHRVGGVITADPALAGTPSGGVLAVVRGADNAGWVNVGNATGTSWAGWQNIGGKLASAPSVTVVGSKAEVFAYGTDGRIWGNVASDASTGRGWSGWRLMP